MGNFNMEYASLSAPEKRKVQKLLLNVAVEPTANTSIMKFKAKDVGLDNTKRITKKQCNEAFSTRIRGSG